VLVANLLLGCALITAMLTALAGLGVAGRWVWRLLRNVSRLLDDWFGEEPRPAVGFEGRPGLVARLSTMQVDVAALREQNATFEQRLAAVEAQMQPNGGRTLRDTVDRVAAAVAPESPSDEKPL
jgi:hypothetical protein